jgi:hypothetical protein
MWEVKIFIESFFPITTYIIQLGIRLVAPVVPELPPPAAGAAGGGNIMGIMFFENQG